MKTPNLARCTAILAIVFLFSPKTGAAQTEPTLPPALKPLKVEQDFCKSDAAPRPILRGNYQFMVNCDTVFLLSPKWMLSENAKKTRTAQLLDTLNRKVAQLAQLAEEESAAPYVMALLNKYNESRQITDRQFEQSRQQLTAALSNLQMAQDNLASVQDDLKEARKDLKKVQRKNFLQKLGFAAGGFAIGLGVCLLAK